MLIFHHFLNPIFHQAAIPSHPEVFGRIIAPFGKSGKLRLQLSKPAPPNLIGATVLVEFKKYLSVQGQFISQWNHSETLVCSFPPSNFPNLAVSIGIFRKDVAGKLVKWKVEGSVTCWLTLVSYFPRNAFYELEIFFCREWLRTSDLKRHVFACNLSPPSQLWWRKPVAIRLATQTPTAFCEVLFCYSILQAPTDFWFGETIDTRVDARRRFNNYLACALIHLLLLNFDSRGWPSGTASCSSLFACLVWLTRGSNACVNSSGESVCGIETTNLGIQIDACWPFCSMQSVWACSLYYDLVGKCIVLCTMNGICGWYGTRLAQS